MSTTAARADNPGMNHDHLLNLAIQLAYQAFDQPTDEHVLAVFHRLAWNWRYGMGAVGATTVH